MSTSRTSGLTLRFLVTTLSSRYIPPGVLLRYCLKSPLQPGGRDIPVTAENVDEYVQEVIDAIVGKGAQAQAQAFRDGFSKVFPISDLQAFTCDELAMLFGNGDEDWTTESAYSWRFVSRFRGLSFLHSPERNLEGRSRLQRRESCHSGSH